MKRFFTLLALCLALATPVAAQTDAPAPQEQEPSFLDFIDRMMREFLNEVEPQIRDLERGLETLEPELQDFLNRMREMTRYHPPEVLPNGDILIRRRQADDPPDDPDQPDTVPQDDVAPSRNPFEL